MNALFEFILLSTFSLFLFMFIGYKDATRSSAPKGMLANLFNNLSFWKSEDKKGIRGYLFRQNFILKLTIAFVGAVIIRLVYSTMFEFSTATESFNTFTGLSGFLMHIGIILAAIYLSYLWPAVSTKMSDLKNEVIKDKSEKEAEKTKELEEPLKPIIKESPTPESAKPSEPKKDDPNDIINDYLN